MNYIGDFVMNVTPPWWRMAKHSTHWAKVNEAIWTWDNPMRGRIRSVTVGFQVVEVTVVVSEDTTTGRGLLDARNELHRRLSILDKSLLEDELTRARENTGGRYVDYQREELERYWAAASADSAPT